MRNRWRALVGASLLPVVGASGCTVTDNNTPELGAYSEPGWMADTRREQEKGAVAMAACMGEHGWVMTVKPDWGLDSSSSLDEAQERAQRESFRSCYDQVYGEQPPVTEADWHVKYQKALDTRDCLVAEGYTIPDPPSEDARVDAGMNEKDLWAPFQFVIDQSPRGQIDLSAETYYELYATCPQAGPNASLSF